MTQLKILSPSNRRDLTSAPLHEVLPADLVNFSSYKTVFMQVLYSKTDQGGSDGQLPDQEGSSSSSTCFVPGEGTQEASSHRKLGRQ